MSEVSLFFDIDGKYVLEPTNWKGLEETLIYGNISNQPVISSDTFDFVGDGCQLIYDNYKKGLLLKPLTINGYYTQPNAQAFILKDYIIDGSVPPRFKMPLFNGNVDPLSVTVGIRKKQSVEDIQAELDGITWRLLEREGFIKDSDFNIVKTAVMPLYNFSELAITIISLYIINKQIEDLIFDTIELSIEFSNKLVGLDPTETVAAGVWFALQLALRAITNIILTALLINAISDLLKVLLPPVVRNKGLTWRKGLDAIFGYLDLEYECEFEEIEYETILPSKPSSNEQGIFDGLLTKIVPNDKGYPNDNDVGYIASDYIDTMLLRFNARLDFIEGKVYIRKEEDDALFKQSKFKEKFNTNYNEFYPNIEDIPNTRLISFLQDGNDEYTYENKKGTFYELKNQSKDGYLPFKGLERIDIPYALGNAKTKLVGLEKLLLQLAKAGDAVTKLFGKKSNLEKKLKKNRVNILKVSHNNYSVAKLLPMKNGQLTGQSRDLLSAKVIENKWYNNRRLSENGQKEIYPNVEMPFNLEDRENVLLNGNFVNSLNQEATFREIAYRWASDRINCEIEVRNKYLAEDSYEEIFIEP